MVLDAQADEYKRRDINEVELYVMLMRFVRWAGRAGRNSGMHGAWGVGFAGAARCLAVTSVDGLAVA